MIIAEYRYRHRSIFGLIGVAVGVAASVGMLGAGFAGHWFWFVFAALLMVATIASVINVVQNGELGCSVDEKKLIWWSTNFPKSDNSIQISDIVKIHLHTTGDDNELRIKITDGSIIKLNSRYIGGGQEIFEAVLKVCPEIESDQGEPCRW